MTPRTACTAVGKVLMEEMEGEYIPNDDILDESGRFIAQKKHSTVQQLIANNIIHENDLENLFVFTTVRNHFDNLYSLYTKQKDKYKPLLDDKTSWVYKVPGYVEKMKYCQEHSFDEWLDREYGIPWYKKLIDFGHRTLYTEFTEYTDFVMKFENIQEDFNIVLNRINFGKELLIPRYNETGVKEHKNYKNAFSDASRRLVEYVFSKELKKYGYKF